MAPTLDDIDRVLGMIQRVQPQIALVAQGVVGLIRLVRRKREAGHPVEDADLARETAETMAACTRADAALAGAEDAARRRLAELDRR